MEYGFKVVKRTDRRGIYTGPIYPGVDYKVGETVKVDLALDYKRAAMSAQACAPGINVVINPSDLREFILVDGGQAVLLISYSKKDMLGPTKFNKQGNPVIDLSRQKIRLSKCKVEEKIISFKKKQSYDSRAKAAFNAAQKTLAKLKRKKKK